MKTTTDNAGFPMIWLDVVGAYVHWLPVTKIQVESFLSAAPSPKYDERWYDNILSQNPRVSARQIKDKNYWGAFATGLLPEEANDFAEWNGENYSIPTLEEWNKIYQYCKAQPYLDASFDTLNLKERPRALITKLNELVRSMNRNSPGQQALAFQMIMRYGVMEWVRDEHKQPEWVGMGQPNTFFRNIFTQPEQGIPERPKDPLARRMSYYGLRLLRRD